MAPLHAAAAFAGEDATGIANAASRTIAIIANRTLRGCARANCRASRHPSPPPLISGRKSEAADTNLVWSWAVRRSRVESPFGDGDHAGGNRTPRATTSRLRSSRPGVDADRRPFGSTRPSHSGCARRRAATRPPFIRKTDIRARVASSRARTDRGLSCRVTPRARPRGFPARRVARGGAARRRSSCRTGKPSRTVFSCDSRSVGRTRSSAPPWCAGGASLRA